MARKHEDDPDQDRAAVLSEETVDAIERAAGSKLALKAERWSRKAQKKALKQAKKDASEVIKQAGKHGGPGEPITMIAETEHSRFTPRKARNAVGVVKVLAPVVIPVLAPFAVRVAGAGREAYDRRQARKLGVQVDQLGEFTGRGAALHARIAGLAEGLADLRRTHGSGSEHATFAEQSQSTLEQLAATVRAAERMPTPRRKAAHRAVGNELERLESQLLHRLGV